MKNTEDLKRLLAERDEEISRLKIELNEYRAAHGGGPDVAAGSGAPPEDIRETQRGFTSGFMEELSAAESELDVVRTVARRLKYILGFEAVAVRLRKENDYPYYFVDGFTKNFVEAENLLCMRTEDGKVVQCPDADGKPALSCLCGAVINGGDPSSPFFTEYGSFWTNSISLLMEKVSPEELPPYMRFRCGKEGYESVALVPLRAGNANFGLIQIDDRRKGVFDKDSIYFLESIAAIVAETLKRKQAEIQLQESEARYRTLVENIPIGIYRNTPGPEGRFLAANPFLARMHGFSSPEEIMEAPVSSLYVNPADRKELSDALCRLGRVQDFEVKLRRADGMEFFASVDARAVPGENGETAYFDGIIQDITATKTAMEALRESEEKFRNIIHMSPLGVLIYSIAPGGELVLVDANSSADRMLKVDLDEKIGQTIEEAFPGLEGTETVRMYRRAAAEGIPWYSEQIEYKDNSISGAFEVFAFQTAPGMMAAMFLDITLRKKQEAEQHKLISIIENSREFIGLSDLEGNMIYLNEAGCELVGVEALGINNRKVFDFMPQDRLYVILKDTIPNIISDGIWKGSDIIRNARTGEEIDADITILQLADPGDGRPMCWAIIINDIRDRLKAEKEKDLLHRQLLQAQKMEAIGHLAGGIAHDFNNMLGVILGYSQMMLSDLAPDHPDRDSLVPIVEAAKRSKELTMKMLTFARKDKLNVAQVEATTLVDDTVSLLRRSISKKINIVVDVDPDIFVNVDRNQIHQALLNICNNACDAMPDGGTLSISCDAYEIKKSRTAAAPGLAPGRYCRVRISDTGTGIHPEVLRKMFDPFFTTKEVGKGTGLGLSVTHGIIQNHNGRITAESEPGCGAVFTIMLPMSVEQGRAVKAQEARETVLPGDETILVIDDEAQMLNVIFTALSKAGYKVKTAHGGPAGVEAYRQSGDEISMVILDLLMPDMDGREVFGELRTLNPEAKILLSSGFSEDGVAAELLQLGAVDFIQKPFLLSELSVVIRKILDKGQQPPRTINKISG